MRIQPGNNFRKLSANHRVGFSLIELVIVVVILAIIGAIVIPRMSRGAAGAGDSAVAQDLSILRSALDLYFNENNGTYPTGDKMPYALVLYNDGNGNLSATQTGAFINGPYLASIPPLPVGASKGATGIAITNSPTAQPSTNGWTYSPSTGQINANTTSEADAKGVAYNTY